MVTLIFVLLFFFLLLPFLLAVFVASGLLIFTRPQGLRPAWWDWGMDEAEPVARVETAPVEPVVRAELESAPRVAVPEKAKRADGPRWWEELKDENITFRRDGACFELRFGVGTAIGAH